ncbi:MAG TPA: fused MFS/spermidine synthase [Bacteroidia bacterium]|nr:fused MFS/spermidine synthase [Bacteroidia bacterium]
MSSTRKYYALALLEGIGVISVELLSAKILAPYFGTSLVIWTSVIGITLVALAASYSLGARLSQKPDRERLLFILFGLGAVFLAWMPVSGPLLFRLFSGFPLLLSVTVCAFLLLVPPILCLGSTTPLLIQGITRDVKKAGRVSGNVYAISTSGGIVTTFSLGFFVIPEWGISKPTLFAALALLGVANLLLRNVTLRWRLGLAAGLLGSALVLVLPSDGGSGALNVVFEQEGVLGQVKVVDEEPVGDIPKARKLLFNGIPQTNMLKGDYSASSHFNYVHMLATLSSMKPPGSEVLLCGLGGGSLVMEYQRLGFKTDVVDIDARLPWIGERYFYLDPKAFSFYLDDARHFIHEHDKVYDIITMDIILAEAQPYHLYTIEAFKEFKKKIKSDGLLIVNMQGQIFGKEARAERSIFRTLQDAGFEVHVVPSIGKGIQDIIFVASPTRVPFENLNVRRLNPCCINVAMADVFVQEPLTHVVSDPDLRDALSFVDDRPMLDLIRLPAVLEFRRNKIKSIADKELESEGKLFK